MVDFPDFPTDNGDFSMLNCQGVHSNTLPAGVGAERRRDIGDFTLARAPEVERGSRIK